MLRVGVAGAGNLGKLHVSSLLSMPEWVVVAALADPIEERRSGRNLKTRDLNLAIGTDETATADDVRAYDDYRALCVDEALDVVVIAMPSDLHVITGGGKETVDLTGLPGGHRAELVYFIQCLIEDKPVDRCQPGDSALAVRYARGD